jgi:hypothetical protein
MVAAVLVAAFIVLAALWFWFWAVIVIGAFRGILERDQ